MNKQMMLTIALFINTTSCQIADITPIRHKPTEGQSLFSTPTMKPQKLPEPTQQPSQTPTDLLPYNIIRTELEDDQKKESGLKVNWGKSLAELAAGEYILTYSPCTGDICYEIRAYAIQNKQSEFIVRMEGKDVSEFTFHGDYFIFVGWDNPNSIEVVDLFHQTNYALRIGGKHTYIESLHNSNWLLIASKYINYDYLINLRERKIVLLSNKSKLIRYANYFIWQVGSDENCKPILLTNIEMVDIPLNLACDDSLFTWSSSTGGKWLWHIAFDEQKQEGTFDIIPAECVLEHLDDPSYCEKSIRTIFYIYYDPGCYHYYYWTQDDGNIIDLSIDAIVPCGSKGARLYDLNGRQTIIRNYPIYILDLWTSDKKWVVWESSINDDWGLFSPYSGGEISTFGNNRIYDYSIYKTLE